MKNLEYRMQYTKAGEDMDKPEIAGYMKKERLI
jgi:hypothetical protein